MHRILDLIIAVSLLPILIGFSCIFSVYISLESNGPVFYKSERIGKNMNKFVIYKFRTMYVGAPLIATSSNAAAAYVTKFGRFLRLSSLDELPQLLNILNGTMSFIGPRPCLACQLCLISLRDRHGVFAVRPGLTGLAQIKGRDLLSVKNKVRYDYFYINNRSIGLDIKILVLTMLKMFRIEEISH